MLAYQQVFVQLLAPIGTILDSWDDFVALRFVICQKMTLQICYVCSFDLNFYLVVGSNLYKSPGVCKNKIRHYLLHRQLRTFDAFVVLLLFVCLFVCFFQSTDALMSPLLGLSENSRVSCILPCIKQAKVKSY